MHRELENREGYHVTAGDFNRVLWELFHNSRRWHSGSFQDQTLNYEGQFLRPESVICGIKRTFIMRDFHGHH